MKKEETGAAGSLEGAAEEEKEEEKAATEELDLQDLYEPRFLDRHVTVSEDGKKKYNYTVKGNKYWDDRAAGTFHDYLPNIFDENCI